MSVLNSPLSIDDILITPELQRRPQRLADYAAENKAMMALALEMANNPQNLLPLLAQFARKLCQAGSAGISLLEDVDGETVFRWPAISGAFAGHVCGSSPREFSRCGIVLDRGAPQLYSYLARYFTYMQGTEPEIIESLVIPIYTKGEAVGTMWVLAHDEQRRFDAEDERLLTNLGNFTAAALQVIGARDLAQQSALKIALAHEELETQVQERTQALHSANAALRCHQTEVEDLNARLRRAMTETHHRVKNNLQIIAALVDMQTIEAENTIPVEEWQRLGIRIRTLAVVHDTLTDAVKEKESAQRISARAILRKVVSMLEQAAGPHQLVFTAEDAGLTSRQGTALALCIQELYSNALKHGKGWVAIHFKVQARQAVLEVSNNGQGFPAAFDPVRDAHTGLDLVQSLAQMDLAGCVCFTNRPDGSGCVTIEFPLPDDELKEAS